MDKNEMKETRDKILRGINLAFDRLVEQKKKEDGELVFSQDGKIVRIKARDVKRRAVQAIKG
ncbi:MAG: hypothetical protein LBU95_04600 [Rikenellaceae bacterium]|jgi:hypothetical protein|nr:hypothetical protein [Rikenellaceae bacterium]